MRWAGFGVVSVLFYSCSTLPLNPTGKNGLLDDLSQKTGHPGMHDVGNEALKELPGLTLTESKKIREALNDWELPLKDSKVTSPFGKRSRKFHEGVDLRARVGTPVFSVAPGKVVYSGSRIKGYGHMLVIEHENNLYTVYAHNSALNVKRGESVTAGQKIALSGRSGRVSGPHLHFEIRKGTVPVDPGLLLDQPKQP